MAETTTDHEAIRKWAESKDGRPAAVDRTHQGGDVGIIRLMFPKARESEHESLVEITWDEFFDEFEKRDPALVYDDKSMFNKLVGRDTAQRREQERARRFASLESEGADRIRRDDDVRADPAPVTGSWVTPSWAACPACRSA